MMPIISDWDLDPGSDLQSIFSLDLTGLDELTDGFYYNTGLGPLDDIYKKYQSTYYYDQFLDSINHEIEGEFYMNHDGNNRNHQIDDKLKKSDIYNNNNTNTNNNNNNNSNNNNSNSSSTSSNNGNTSSDDDDNCDRVEDQYWMNELHCSEYDDAEADAREIRNHDCMWAGHCISEKHDRNNQKNGKCVNLMPIKKSSKMDDVETISISTTFDGGNKLYGGRKGAIVAPTHARSLLLPTRIVNSTQSVSNNNNNHHHHHNNNNYYNYINNTQRKSSLIGRNSINLRMNNNNNNNNNNKSRTLYSGGESPRPETPQSLTDNEDLNLDLSDLKGVEELVADSFDYNFVNELVQNVGSEDSITTGDDDESCDDFVMNFWSNDSSNVIPSTKSTIGNNNKMKRTVVKQEIPISRHYTTHSFFSDHCYHLNKNARMDNLGVQTPSDSEEEIDVETVYGDSKKPNSRSSSSGAVLPTNPSLSDRQQLQLTVASAINKKEVKKTSARTSSIPTRYSLDDRTLKPKMIHCKRKLNVRNEVSRRTGGKRSAQFDDYNECVNKSVKRKKYQYQRHYKQSKSKKSSRNQRTNARSLAGSSDSEVDSIERRTIHNSMERQRRIDLRNSFENLRKLIPHTAGNEKAAKVVILSCGAEFCKALTLEDSELTKKKAELRRQQEILMARVSQLRKSLAAQR